MASPKPSPSPSPSPTATSSPAPIAALPISSATASANDGNVPANAVDGNLSTRWSCNGIGCWIRLDLGSLKSVSGAKIAWYAGNTRKNNFVIATSSDGVTYASAHSGQSSGTTTALETYSFTARNARYVRITVNGNTSSGSSTWASISEIQVLGRAIVSPSPTPTPTVTSTPSPTPTVTSSPTPSPFMGTPAAIPGIVQAENFDNGGQGLAYNDTTTGNVLGLYRTTDVDVGTSADGGYRVGYIFPGEYLVYTVNVATAGQYTLQVRYATTELNSVIHFELDGANVSGSMAMPATGAWETYSTVSKVLTLPAGRHLLKFVNDSGYIDLNHFNFVQASVSPSPTPTSSTGPGYSVIRNGRVEIDGKPFFPHGFYHVSWNASATELISVLRTVAAAGFNTMHTSRTSTNNYGAFLDEAARLGVKIISEGVDPSTISTLKSKPAVLGWNIGDDVHENTTPDALLAKHNSYKAADPNHITYYTVYSWSKWGPFFGKGDIIAPYNYPISGSWLGEVDYAMNQARQYGKPMFGIPQAFNWSGQRAPTAQEARNMTYQNLVNNVKGLVYYNYNEGALIPDEHPELWAGLKTHVAEVNRLSPALLGGTYTKLSTGVDRALAATWKLGNELYVVVINVDPSLSKTVSLTLPAVVTGSAQPLFRGRPSGMVYSGGKLSGTIGAQHVHVYMLPVQ